ncbi:flavin reductase family protein [Methyloligella solikamskensis]|uniref:Flavin reductase family protein n=1 Tax=Methyloligella solikamskensis TaxID=1177756 RepID=A0ABW3J7M5_9HYPH
MRTEDLVMDEMRELFLNGMSRVACTVSLVTTEGEGGKAGVTVSAMSSVSADSEHPSLLVCVHELSAAADAIRQNGAFCVNVLGKEQAFLSDVFAGRAKDRYPDKFSAARWSEGASGSPVLEGALVNFDCHVKEAFHHGTHWIIIGGVIDMRMADPGSPLVYANHAYSEPAPLLEQEEKAAS